LSKFLSKNKTVAIKKEATSGTAETLSVTTDAIRAEDPRATSNFETIDNDNEVTGALDAGAPMPSGGTKGIAFTTTLRGSGTGGVVPETSAALQASGFAEKITAADISDTAQAGGANTITLAAGASATDDEYLGMVINIDGGTGTGQSSVIVDYNGTTKVATVAANWTTQPDITSTYTIPANVLYRPASSGLPTATVGMWQHSTQTGQNSRLTTIAGASSTFSLELATRGKAMMSFDFTGKLLAPSDVAHPGDAVFDTEPGRPFIDADVLLGGVAVKFGRFTLDLGSEINLADDPAATYGYDTADITARKVTGSINPYMSDLATRNNFAVFQAATEQSLWLRWGPSAGKRVSIMVPQLQLTGADDGDNNGRATDDIPFQANGANNGVFICLH